MRCPCSRRPAATLSAGCATKTGIDALPGHFAACCGVDQGDGNRADAALLVQQRADDLAIRDWVATEVSSALSIKVRTGQIEASHRAGALATYNRLATDSFTVV